MQLADCSSPSPAHDRAPQSFSGQNQKAYLRLKLALSLSLRRQIFLAVCDDVALRNRLAARLYAELGYASPKPLAIEATPARSRDTPVSLASPHGNRLSVIADDGDAASTPSTALPSSLLYPRLVSLNLNLTDPNPMVQIAEWLAQYPPPKGTNARSRSPGFQILGIERLTRQPALVQKRFLHSLQQIEHYLSCLESPLLLWLPRPWLNAVKQSAPNFWNWHTALFEFEGDPTPLATVVNRLSAHHLTSSTSLEATAVSSDQHQGGASPILPLPSETTLYVGKDAAISDPVEPLEREGFHGALDGRQSDNGQDDGQVSGAIAQTAEALEQRSTPARNNIPASKDDLWAILTHDLALLNQPTAVKPSSEPSDVESFIPIAPAKAAVPSIEASIQTVDPATPDLLSPSSASKNNQSATVEPAEVELTEVEAAEVEPAETAALTAESVGAAIAEPAVERRSDADSFTQNQAALDLSDLILAVVAEEDGDQPSSQNAQIIQALQQIEQLHLQQAPKATLLAAYQNLGNLCRDRIEQGYASSRHLLLTICVYEQTLQWLDDASLLWSDILNDIGNLYWMLARHEAATDDSLTYLEQAIATYQQALSTTNPDTRPHNYAMIQNNLGSAYGDMARFRTPAESLEQSVVAYEAALRYRQLHDDPARYAATQNNLGTAYWNLAQHQQPVRRLKQSIAAYFEALRYYSPDCEPMHYAMIQNNLGTAYWNLAQQPQAKLGVGTAKGKDLSGADLLQRAIAAYRAALVYRTLAVAPAAHAATQNNLGTACWQLAILLTDQPERRYELLQQAIESYKEAIAAVDYLSATKATHTHALSFDPAATHNNLGLAYYQLATDKQSRESSAQRSAGLEAALHHHLQALQAWQAQPDLYQTVFSYVLQTMRAFHSEFGTKGQTQALSQIPANLLPEVLKQL
ncbi:MAG: tetratricopeptide repeat protein [Lyngbya sp. HA4199-MV5]|jgi:tetratricopeptide (TPR) repeat protein|nr:tetratricopeptide repeat protein [Lyngbya sp. HA4199-MV5]